MSTIFQDIINFILSTLLIIRKIINSRAYLKLN